MDTEQESITDDDLYEAATETPAPEPEAKEGRERDELGRFASKQESQPEEAEEAVEAASEPTDQQPERVDHRIPLTELLNEREKRQAEARRAQQLQQELETLRQQMQPPKQQEPIPDQFQSPEQYNAWVMAQGQQVQQTMEQRLWQQEANFSLRLAKAAYGPELFEAAYKATLANPNLARQVANSPDPGETMVALYKREQVLAQVGDNPETYVQKKLEEALNDPKFLAKAIERARSAASTQPAQVKLPPSLNKATSAARSDDTSDLSDRSLYHHATGR
jgi:hypothetical protein